MNPAHDLLVQAEQAGLEVSAVANRLKWRSRKRPPDDLLAALKANKPELIDLLSAGGASGSVATGKPVDDAGGAKADFDERTAIIEDGAGVPREWAEGFARLDLTNRPSGFSLERWQQVINDGGLFLDRWGAEAASLNGRAEDVFGVDPAAPDGRYDRMGLVPLIGGKEVVAIAADAATIRHKTGSVGAPARRPEGRHL